jgi:hypothetical protein
MTGDELHAVSRMTEVLPGSRSVPVGRRVAAVLAAPLAPLFGLLVAYLVYHPPRPRRRRAPAAFGLHPTGLWITGPSARARLPVAPVPAATSFQPIDAAEVADRLANLATGPPRGRVPDVGGPEIRTATDLLRVYLHATGRHRPVLPVRLPGTTFAGYRHGGHFAPDRAVGRRTWERFLADQLGHRRLAGVVPTAVEGRA